MRICIVGNSHIVAIKEGFDALVSEGEFSSGEVTMFGSQGSSLSSCFVRDGILQSNEKVVRKNFAWTSKGQNQIILSQYDEVYVVAGPSFFSIRNFLARAYLPPLSDGLVEDIIAGRFESWDFDLARMIASNAPDARVYHLGAPFGSDHAPHSRTFLTNLGKDMALQNRVQDLIGRLNRKAAEFSGRNFSILNPPPNTLESNGLFTRHEFCIGSKPLARLGQKQQHSATDYGHMNAEYGKALLRQYVLQRQTAQTCEENREVVPEI